mgnify:CR=1 FL=1
MQPMALNNLPLEEVNLQQLLDITYKYIVEHPKERHLKLHELIVRSLNDAFKK